ncbi:hypothetical protein FIBSPDRAFT_854220 [Athelia psychrophila]|nr:hypothetical protein FIBSPDRAFT_854220 [Fibularhizoctonia sp. CBS 109695]
MALNAWNAPPLGMLYLAFRAFQFIFTKHGFSADQTGTMFLGTEVGVVGAICRIPYWNPLFEKEMLNPTAALH